MPTSTIILIAVLSTLILWTVFHLVKDIVRKLSKGSDNRSPLDEISDLIEVEREKDRQRMGSMFASISLSKRNSGRDGDA